MKDGHPCGDARFFSFFFLPRPWRVAAPGREWVRRSVCGLLRRLSRGPLPGGFRRFDCCRRCRGPSQQLLAPFLILLSPLFRDATKAAGREVPQAVSSTCSQVADHFPDGAMKDLVTAEVNGAEAIGTLVRVIAHIPEVANGFDFNFVGRNLICRSILSTYFDAICQSEVARVRSLILRENQLRSCQEVDLLWIDGKLRKTLIEREVPAQRLNLDGAELDAIQQKKLRGHYL